MTKIRLSFIARSRLRDWDEFRICFSKKDLPDEPGTREC